jgi:broad specificity phosphatase PhoE
LTAVYYDATIAVINREWPLQNKAKRDLTLLRLYLVRHGETAWNHENRAQGWSDIPLDAQGLRQAEALAAAFADLALEAVYASTLVRAIVTAERIAAPHGLEVRVDPDLREMNQGSLDGMKMIELRRNHAALLQDWADHPATFRMPGGETLSELQARTWTAIERIAGSHREGAVVVVSHNLAIVSMVCRVLGLPMDRFRRIRQDVAAINILEFGGSRDTCVVRLNDTSHLKLLQADGDI